MKIFAAFLTAVAFAGHAAAQSAPALAERVRAELLFSWRAYERYAWGHDELRPVSKTPRDWYGQSLLITPVDALDSLILMGFDDEAAKARKLIDDTLCFHKDISVKNFEITIRVLGGLLSGYELTGATKRLALADDLGTRLLPVFNSPTGMPYVNVTLQTGKTSGTKSNPAEVGTLLLEFGTLSKLTHKPVYYAKAKNALVQLYRRRSKIGLVGAATRGRGGAAPATSAAGSIRTTSTCSSARVSSATKTASRCGARASKPSTRTSRTATGTAKWTWRRGSAPLPSSARCTPFSPASSPSVATSPARRRSRPRRSACGSSTASSPRSSTTRR